MRRCKNCAANGHDVSVALRPMPHLGFGLEPIWVHVEQLMGRNGVIGAETYYRTCMSQTFAEPQDG